MRRSALKIKADGSYGPLATKLYKKQRNYVVILSRKTKKEYFQQHMPHGLSSKNIRKFRKSFHTKPQTFTINNACGNKESNF